jgi:hypothetical protein
LIEPHKVTLMEAPRRWAVALASDNAIDLKIACELFRIGDPRVEEIKVFTGRVETALFSDQFEKMSAASDVADASIPIIDAINGICFIHDSARSSMRRSGVHERLPTGEWDGGVAFLSVAVSSGSFRVTGFSATFSINGNVQAPRQSPQSVWLQNAVHDASALDVLAYIRGTPDWFLLYKAYEAMKADGGTTAEWPDTNRFTRSANIRRHFSGHPSAQQKPGKRFVPMELSEATDFIRSLAKRWLNSKFPDA